MCVSVCVYVYVCVYMYIPIYVYVYIHPRTLIFLCIYLYLLELVFFWKKVNRLNDLNNWLTIGLTGKPKLFR